MAQLPGETSQQEKLYRRTYRRKNVVAERHRFYWQFGLPQNVPPMPVIGFLHAGNERTRAVASFEKGLAEGGYVADRNVAFELRWADGQFDRLPALAAELVSHNVAVIAAFGNAAARAAKAATPTIPIAFASSSDPVAVGLVSSLNRPGWNVTGVIILNQELESPRLERLVQVVPHATTIAFLVNPDSVTADAAGDGERSAPARSGSHGGERAQRKRVRAGLPQRRGAADRGDGGHLRHHVLQ